METNTYDLFESYIERRPRCRAVVVKYGNVWVLSDWLAQLNYMVNIRRGPGGMFLEVQRGDNSFSASVDNGDALILNGYDDVEFMDGKEFRKAWEKEESK